MLSTIINNAVGCAICTLESEVLIDNTNSSLSSIISSNIIKILTQKVRLLEESGTNIIGRDKGM